MAMQLKLIFEGEEPMPQSLMAEVLRLIDQRLFVYEQQALTGLPRQCPQLTKGHLAEWRRELNRQYRAGEFSMLYVQAVRPGSVEVILTVGAHVVETVVAGAILLCVKDAFKNTPAAEELTRHLRFYFLRAQHTRVIKAVLDMSKRYNQTPPVVEEVADDIESRSRRRLLEMEDPTYALPPSSHSLSVSSEIITFYAKRASPSPAPPTPTERLVVKSIIARRPAFGQPMRRRGWKESGTGPHRSPMRRWSTS